jgi:hypothetical protein
MQNVTKRIARMLQFKFMSMKVHLMTELSLLEELNIF